MSQQGADDWWQKLYEDPDAGPEADPGDTLDHRFRSAAGVTADPAAPASPAPPEREWGPEQAPERGPLPGPRPGAAPDAGLPARPPVPDAFRKDTGPPGPVPVRDDRPGDPGRTQPLLPGPRPAPEPPTAPEVPSPRERHVPPPPPP
ncbi:cell division protein, partial [Streptomyces sp. MB09-01]|nr:cell division protein [Streptomyces sp. MB09-01]